MTYILYFNFCFIFQVFVTLVPLTHIGIKGQSVLHAFNLTEYPVGCTYGDVASDHLYRNLTTLNCSFKKLEAFPENIPQDIQVINMKGNSISKISKNMDSLNDLQELDLSGNKIKFLGRRKLFLNSSTLVYLDISKNCLAYLYRENLKSMKMLEQLILSDNDLKYLENKTFSDLENLKVLHLQYNKFSSLNKRLFYNLESLEFLDLSYNRISNLAGSVFKHTISLKSLNLTGNQVVQIDPRAFSGLTKLKILNLDSNQIDKIPTSAFQSLPVLDVLSLNGNPFTKVKPLDFSHLSVTKISLSQMPELTIIEEKGFYNLINVSSIIMNYNKKLTYIDPLSFMNVASLKTLDLNDNNMQGLQREIQQNLPKGLQLSIYNNPIRCDCNMRWLRNMLVMKENPSLELSKSEHILCSTPEKFKHKKLMDIDLPKLGKTCPPVVLNLTQSSHLIRKVGERFVIECRALGSPIPKLNWILPDGSVINSNINEISRRFFEPGTLVLNRLQRKDFGTYKCVADNSFGSSNNLITLTASITSSSITPIHVGSTFVTLVWSSKIIEKYHDFDLLYSETNGNRTEDGKIIRMISPNKRYTIEQLEAEKNYKICLGFEDITGLWRDIACCQISTLKSEHSSKDIYVISSVTLILILVIIFTISFMASRIISITRKKKDISYDKQDKNRDEFDDGPFVLYQPILKTSCTSFSWLSRIMPICSKNTSSYDRSKAIIIPEASFSLFDTLDTGQTHHIRTRKIEDKFDLDRSNSKASSDVTDTNLESSKIQLYTIQL